MPRAVILVLLGTAFAVAAAPSAVPPGTVEPGDAPDFSREVRPILADHCFRCHGADPGSRKRGLRLDVRDGALLELASGVRAVVPGDPDASELVHRIMTDDAEDLMPPADAKAPLTEAQKDVLVRWIRSGAEYRPHWAFEPPRTPAAPAGADPALPADPLDRLVLARAPGLTPTAEADRPTLLRRASLALTGLPPTPEEVDAFAADASPDAYEKRIDALLASPRFGERLAADWLDAARFADTFGYQSDRECRVWPWRDWVIRAFNDNLPYDRFLRDQIAGDLLPSATQDQRTATAFCRLHRQTNEGGSIDEEFRQEYISDRVHTFGTAFLGLTVECARCHDHKYDPIPQRDYYSLAAFFGDLDESGTYAYSTGAVPGPTMRLATPEQQARLDDLAKAERDAATTLSIDRAVAAETFQAPREGGAPIRPPEPVLRAELAGDVEGPGFKGTALDGDRGPVIDKPPAFRRCDPLTVSLWVLCPDTKARAVILHTSNFTIEADQQGYQLLLKDGRLAWEVLHLWPSSAAAILTTDPFPIGRWVHISATYDGSSRAAGLRLFLDGAPARTTIAADTLDGPATVRTLQIGFRDRDLGLRGGAAADLRVFDRDLSAAEAAELAHPGAANDRIAKGDLELLRLHHADTADPTVRQDRQALREARRTLQDATEALPELMVMKHAASPRPSFILTRGRYDAPDLGRPVGPDRAIEGILPFGTRRSPGRLGLAEWATDPANPLTARVEVNRLWALCFGRGLVQTQENFGVQGTPPTHPEVLDLLASDFVRSGWDIKALLRRIVRSAAFRRASEPTRESLERDPLNALLSRGPSFRLSAEALRDQALHASGLLVEKLGGPSVKPYQPPGLWEDAGADAQGNGGYTPDTGEAAHRRSLYTYRKRTAPPPNMLAFDAGSREVCLARRQPTNTPQQALVLLNDPVFVECARALAARAAKEAPADPITRAFRLVVARRPRPAELKALRGLLAELEKQAAADPLALVCSTILASDAAVTAR